MTNKHNEFLTIEVEGSAVGSGRIGIIALRDLITEFYKLVERTGLKLADYEESSRSGRRPKEIEEYIAIDMVRFDHGSTKTVLGFQKRSYSEGGLFGPEADFGNKIYKTALLGLSDVQEPRKPTPDYIDYGILEAVGKFGSVFAKGINQIDITLNDITNRLHVKYTPRGYEEVKKRIGKFETALIPEETKDMDISGRLLMVDFKKEGDFKCKVYPPVGEPVECIFDETKSDEIKTNLRSFVRITGLPERITPYGKITGIHIKKITPLEAKGLLIFPDFWSSLSLKELADMQGVKPVHDMSLLIGKWPGDADDDFE